MILISGLLRETRVLSSKSNPEDVRRCAVDDAVVTRASAFRFFGFKKDRRPTSSFDISYELHNFMVITVIP